MINYCVITLVPDTGKWPDVRDALTDDGGPQTHSILADYNA